MLTASNFPCGRWRGTTRVRFDSEFGGFSEATADVTYERWEDQSGAPIDETSGSAIYVPREGTATVRHVDLGTSVGCIQSFELVSGPIGPLDSIVTMVFDQPGIPNERKVFGTGISTIQGAVHVLDCGGEPIVAPGPAVAHWLVLPITGADIAPDGRTIEGTTTIQSMGGTQTSEWSFEAERE